MLELYGCELLESVETVERIITVHVLRNLAGRKKEDEVDGSDLRNFKLKDFVQKLKQILE